jgi:prevent-host-death family protein
MRRFWRRWSGQPDQTSLTRPSGKGQLALYNTYDARTFFSDLLRRVRAGEEIVIAHAGHPVAKLIPYRQAEQTRPGVVRMTLIVNDGVVEANVGTSADGEASTQPRARSERGERGLSSRPQRIG